MAFKDFPAQKAGVQLLQRSMERGRLAHAYLFTGHQLDELEELARNLAKTLNCLRPVKKGNASVDCCDACLNCKKIDHGNHADVHWVRPESKLRVILIDQIREVMQQIYLKPTEAEWKVAGIVAADRLNVNAANAFLKTLEEPPSKSVLILLTTEPQRMLETIRSRCLRLNFSGDGQRAPDPAQVAWLSAFGEMAASEQKSLLNRYRLMSVLLQKFTGMKEQIEKTLAERSPLQRYEDADEETRGRWEEELKAAIEAEYRRQRADCLSSLQWWLRDVWLRTLGNKRPQASEQFASLFTFPKMDASQTVAGRISSEQALDNLQIIEQLQRRLWTNVQEALALEVGMLKLNL